MQLVILLEVEGAGLPQKLLGAVQWLYYLAILFYGLPLARRQGALTIIYEFQQPSVCCFASLVLKGPVWSEHRDNISVQMGLLESPLHLQVTPRN